MTDKIDVDFSNKDSIFKQLILIEHEFEEMKKKNGLQPDSEDMIQLFTKVITFCHHTIPFKVEEDLIKMAEFDQLALSIRLSVFQARTLDEYYWSKKLQYENSLLSFNRTIFSQEYIDEIKHEMGLLSTIITSKPVERVAYIGSGPLPVGSVQLLLHMPSLKKIINIDCNLQAIEHAKSIAEYNNIIDKMDFIESYAEDLTAEHITRCDILFVAFMVGNDNQSKKKILNHLYKIMQSGMIVFVRTGRALRQILYPSIEMSDIIETGFQPLLEAHPTKKNCIAWSKLIAIKS